jgi:serine/threonine-protein kinase HipA
MNCLCCGKPLPLAQVADGWHRLCVKRFFGTAAMPEIDLSEETFERLAKASINMGYTVPGVQKKLSLHLLTEGMPRLTMIDYPAGFILKPQVKEFTALPESEHLVMSMADVCGIQTVPHALVRAGDALAYITRRVDRDLAADSPAGMLAMEDFCQLDLRLTQDKYRGSYERCARIINRYSSRQGLDLTEMYLRLVFSFLVGNSDMHLKNFSLLETGEGSGRYTLSPAYDLLPVNVIMPEDREEFALTMNGKKRNIRRKDFLIFADSCGIERKPAERMLDQLISLQSRLIAMNTVSLLPEMLKKKFSDLLAQRADAIQARK